MRILKFFSIISLILIILSLGFIFLNPTQGYEISIYTFTPPLFWLSVIIGLLLGMILLYQNLKYNKNQFFWVALEIVLLCEFLIISLYALRGYGLYLGRGDTFTYVGLVKDISFFGQFGSDQYPGLSILISIISQITKINEINLSQFLPAFFFLIYLLSLYCLSKFISFGDNRLIYATMISAIPIFFAWFSTSIYYMLLATLLLPLLMYCIIRSSNPNFKYLSIMLIVLLPLFHQIVVVFFIVYIFILILFEKIIFGRFKINYLNFFILSITCLFLWILYQYSLLHGLDIVLNRFFQFGNLNSSADIALNYQEKLGFFPTVKYIAITNFDEIVYILLSIIVFYLVYKNHENITKKFILYFSFSFIFGLLVLGIFFFVNRIHGPLRLMNLNPNMVFAPIIVGFLIYSLSINKKKMFLIISLCLIFFSIITSIFSLYPSPITSRPNDQITQGDIKSAKWLLTEMSPNIPIAIVATPISRFKDLLFGSENLYYNINQIIIDEHFKNSSVYTHFYLFITNFDKSAYEIIWKNIDKYNESDFDALNNNVGINKIFQNGEDQIYIFLT